MFTGLKAHLGRNLAATVDAQLAASGLPTGPVDDTPVSAAELAGLPDAARRYLRFMDVVGRPRAWSLRAHLRGRFRMRPEGRWMPCEAWQYNTSPDVSRVFHMRIDLGHILPMVGRDTYLGGHGCMHGAVLGLVTVAHGEGPEFDLGELTTYLNDAVLLAPSMLLTPAVRWSEVDDDSFDLSLTDAGRTVTARVFLDDRGAPRDFSSEDRYAAMPEGLVRARWTTPMQELSVVAAGRTPFVAPPSGTCPAVPSSTPNCTWPTAGSSTTSDLSRTPSGPGRSPRSSSSRAEPDRPQKPGR